MSIYAYTVKQKPTHQCQKMLSKVGSWCITHTTHAPSVLSTHTQLQSNVTVTYSSAPDKFMDVMVDYFGFHQCPLWSLDSDYKTMVDQPF